MRQLQGRLFKKKKRKKYLIGAFAGIPLKEGSEQDIRIARETDMASSLKDEVLSFLSSLSPYGGLDFN